MKISELILRKWSGVFVGRSRRASHLPVSILSEYLAHASTVHMFMVFLCFFLGQAYSSLQKERLKADCRTARLCRGSDE